MAIILSLLAILIAVCITRQHNVWYLISLYWVLVSIKWRIEHENKHSKG